MPLEKLLEMWESLAERERKVLLTFGFRLLAGQRKYGPLTKGKKVWNYEAIEEALDASVYLTAMLQDQVDRAFDGAVSAAEKELENPGWYVVSAESSSSR
jgi:hypothetical protein